MRKATLSTIAQPAPDKSPLTVEEFQAIKYLKKQFPPKASIQNMYNRITQVISRLKFFTHREVSEMFNEIKQYGIFSFEDIREKMLDEKYQDQLINMLRQPTLFLNNYCTPFIYSRKNKEWTEEEDAFLIKIARSLNSKPHYSILTLCFPGRCGREIYARFIHLVHEQNLFDLNCLQNPYNPYTRRYFLANAEKTLAEEITQLFKKGIQLSNHKIKKLAINLYKRKWIIAERAAYQAFILENKDIYENIEEMTYTEEFMMLFNDILSRYGTDLLDEKKEHEISDEIIKEFKLPDPKFSETWIRAFLKRNRLSWRRAHFARRGKIDPTYVQIFINQIAHAVTRYTWDKVFNMDETCVHINNGSTKTVAPIGVEQVVIDQQRNEKECFTVIGTCTRFKAYPLIVVSKGTTEQSTLKFQTETNSNTKVFLSMNKNGWTNEDVMLQYLQHLHDEWADKQECALVLDCLAAHRTKAVIQRAYELNIELIYVPANGTGYYQPLDRRIFGVLKSKLRSLAGSTALSGSGRYQIITDHLITAWEAIKSNEKLLREAWNIPRLFKLVDKKYAHFGEGDEDDFQIDDCDEEEEQVENHQNPNDTTIVSDPQEPEEPQEEPPIEYEGGESLFPKDDVEENAIFADDNEDFEEEDEEDEEFGEEEEE